MATDSDLTHPLSWPDTLSRLRDFSSRLLMAIHGIPETDLARPESAVRWSILNVIAHLGDHELMTAVRMRSVLAGDPRHLAGFDQEHFVTAVHSRDSLAELLEQFGFCRRMNLTLVERLSDEELSRSGEHPQYGVLTVRHLIARAQRHQEKHLRQIEAIKSSLRLSASGTFDVSGVMAAHAASARVRHLGQGIRVHDLWRSRGRAAMHVEIDAGATWPGIDFHVPGPEEVYVVSGDFHDGERVYGAASFIHHPAGSSHVPQSREGCTLFVFYPEG